MRYRANLICSLSIIITSLLYTPHATDKDIVIAGNFWEPFTGETLPNKGLASQLVIEVLNNRGYEVDIIIMPWARILFMLKHASDEIDGVVGIWRTEKREEYILMSHPYYTNEFCLMKHTDTEFQYETLDDLTGMVVGVGRNYEYSDQIQNATHFIRAPSVTLDQNLKRLARKRIDLVLTDCVIGQYYLNKLQVEGPTKLEVVFVEAVIESSPLHFGVPKYNPDAEKIIADFNEGLAEFKANGRLQEIYLRWQVEYLE